MFGMNYINGEWSSDPESKPPKYFTSENPSKQEVLATFPVSGAEEVREAAVAADRAFHEWRKVSRVQRADYFDKLAQLLKRDHQKLVEAISKETGKSLNESHAEVIEALHMVQFSSSSGRQSFGEMIASELGTKDAYVQRKPRGVIAVISPWNFPCALPFWCLAPSIVEGNCVVFKPSELTPMVGQIITELLHESGFPPGVFNLIHGDGDVGKMLVEDPSVKTILFTGSAEVGMEIRKHCASTWNKTCSCEMGSKSAVIVFEDADQDLALDVTVASSFKLSGQRCVSAGRILIQRSIFEEFSKKYVEKAGSLKTGDPFESTPPFYGPLISGEQKKRVERYNEMVTNDQDCKVLLPVSSKWDYYISPFVYSTEWGNKPFLKEEVFGPHVALIPFDKVDDAIRIYNDTDYGLGLGVVTEDFRTMRRCRDECDTGMLYLNGGSIAAESHFPFGGVKKSGNGYKSAAGTYRAVTDEISVTTNYERGITWAQGMK